MAGPDCIAITLCACVLPRFSSARKHHQKCVTAQLMCSLDRRVDCGSRDVVKHQLWTETKRVEMADNGGCDDSHLCVSMEVE